MTFYAKALDGLEGTYEYHVGTCLEIASEFLRINWEALEKVTMVAACRDPDFVCPFVGEKRRDQ